MLLATKDPEPKYVIHNKNLDLEELQGINLETIALAKCKQAVTSWGQATRSSWRIPHSAIRGNERLTWCLHQVVPQTDGYRQNRTDARQF